MFDYKRIPASPYREVRICKWVLFFVDADKYYDIIDKSDSINTNWRKFQDNIIKKRLCDKLVNIGRNADAVEDFELFVRKEAAKSFAKYGGSNYALIFDCINFSKPAHFDKIVKAYRGKKTDPFRYYCMNTLADDNAEAHKCDSKDTECAMCSYDAPSKCAHNCLDNLIKELSS